MRRKRPEIIDAEFEVVDPGSRPEPPHWLVITWAEMSNADRIALVIGWFCAAGAAWYWGDKLFF